MFTDTPAPVETLRRRVFREGIRDLAAKNRRVLTPLDIASSEDDKRATVGEFSKWIYRRYLHNKDISAETLDAGKRAEEETLETRERLAKDRVPPLGEFQQWKLKHDVRLMPKYQRGFPIPTLTVSGIELRGTPDLVFREKRTRNVVIVEIKNTDVPLPMEAWPNVPAQLWAYSRIARWTDAPSIRLVAEIWSTDEAPILRHTWVWQRGDLHLEEKCAELFEAYGGRVAGR